MLIENLSGHYRFLKGIDPYSCGVIAEPGWEIVRLTAPSWIPWRKGFEWMDSVLKDEGLPPSALCAMELRSPKPLSMSEFVEFNRKYRSVLEKRKLLSNGLNPIARTNVAPVENPPDSASVHAFSFVRPNPKLRRATFVVAGAGELREGTLEVGGIVRRGEAGPAALMEKATYVLDLMDERLRRMGAGWELVTAVDVYTAHSLTAELRTLLATRLGPALRHGLRWHISRPPVKELEFEMDVRGLACELHGEPL